MDSEDMGDNLPCWSLLDEISLPLLEQGVARYDTLQAALPSILAVDPKKVDNQERLRKVLRIAQLQLEHILKSQHKLLADLDATQTELKEKKEELKYVKRAAAMDTSRQHYACSACQKTFIDEDFLAAHLKKRHTHN